jgi:hypothetical protein
MADGNIEAAISRQSRLEICSRTGIVLKSSAKEGTDAFRWLVQAAREALRVLQKPQEYK